MNNAHRRRKPTSPWLSFALRVVCCLAVTAAGALTSCKKKGSAQAVAPGKAATFAGHDEHGHAHSEEEHTDEVRLTADAIERYGVKVEAAQLWALKPTIMVPARVSFNSEAMAHVGSPLAGRAVEVKVKLGSTVAVDDELVLVESPELGEAQGDLLSKAAAAHAAGPVAELAKTLWERAKGLQEKSQGISLTEVQKREGEYKAAVAAHLSADAQAKAAENRLRVLGMREDEIATLTRTGVVTPRFSIRAPLAGQVVEREVTRGEIVSPEREALVVIADTSALWVLAEIPEAHLYEVGVGARAWVRMGADGQTYEGQVAFVSARVDPATRTAQARIEVPASALPLKAGMFVHVEVVTTDPKAGQAVPVVAVPDGAIQTVEGGPAVFVPVADEENTFAKRSVTIGKAVGGLVPIHAGLVEGEHFVAAGSFILKAELGKSTAEHVH